MKHQVIYSKKSQDDLRKMSLTVAKRIIKKIAFYCAAKDPLEFAKPLVNSAFGQYRFQIGSYRALFDCDKKGKMRILKILKIGHRKDIYVK